MQVTDASGWSCLERVSSLWLSVSSHWRPVSMCKARWLSLRLQFNGTILVSSATVLPISGASVGKWRVRRRFASVETSQTNHAFSKSSKSKHLQMILRYLYIVHSMNISLAACARSEQWAFWEFSSPQHQVPRHGHVTTLWFHRVAVAHYVTHVTGLQVTSGMLGLAITYALRLTDTLNQVRRIRSFCKKFKSPQLKV